MQLFIKRLIGGLIILEDIKPSDTVDNIKSKIDDKAAILPDQQRLIFRGKELHADDGLKLEDYGISGGQTIFLVVKRGGGRKVTRRRRRKRRRKTGRRRKHRRKSRRRKRITRKKTRRRRKNRRKHLRGGASEEDMLWVFNYIKASGGGGGTAGGGGGGTAGGGGGGTAGGGGGSGGLVLLDDDSRTLASYGIKGNVNTDEIVELPMVVVAPAVITLAEFRTALRKSSPRASMWASSGPFLFRSARGGYDFGDSEAAISQNPLTFDEFKKINNGFKWADVDKRKNDGTKVPGNYMWNVIFDVILEARR